MTRKTAFLFPGQGAQYVGMGRDLKDAYPAAAELFRQVDEICGKPLSRMCFEGPMEELMVTENLQPALTAVSLSCLTALNEAGVYADVSVGHSVGEYPALVSSGVLNPADALRLVKKRGEVMHREATAHPGGMAAVIGLPMEEVRDIVREACETGIVDVANHNTAEQIVITGENEAIAHAVRLVKARKAKAVPLKVSGAWHSRLMEAGVGDFRRYMEGVAFSAPRSTMFFNATAATETDPGVIRDIMAHQLVSPVRWYDIIVAMVEGGVDTFVEAGPKKVLSGLVKKIVPAEKEPRIYNVEDVKSLERFLGDVA